MSRLESTMERNTNFAGSGLHEGVTVMPDLGLMVVTCLDPRVDPAAFLGLRLGEAMIVRNAGGRVTRDVIEDVALIGQLAELAVPDGPLFEVAVIHHSQCGTGALSDGGFRSRYAERIGAEEAELAGRAVLDPEATVRADVALLHAAPSVSPRISVSGHVYEVETGLVRTVLDASLIGG